MSDLISRADALMELNGACSNWQDDAKVAEIIHALPSAELTVQTPQTYGKSINPSNAEVVEDYISRADAIEHLKNVKVSYPHADISLPIDLAIKAIELLPSADAVDCTDFINWLTEEVMYEEMWELNAVAYGEIICRKLVELGVLEVTEEPSYYIRPSADAVQGEWVIRENGNKECSVCGHERQDGWDYFCGFCGARMKGGDDNANTD